MGMILENGLARSALAAVAATVLAPALAGVNGVRLDTSDDRVETPLRVGLKRIGTLKPRNASEIRSSNWMVGCETLDRDYCNFDEYKEFIAPLGAKMVRLQGGWWKTERVKGTYDFAWLDRIVDYLRENGVEIFMELSYGNPNYEGGGGWDLSAGFPVGPEGFEKGWIGWVDAMTKRYADKVSIWAIWNEPDIVDPATPGGASAKTPAVIGEFNARTARAIRRNVPRGKGKIAGMALARNEAGFLGECLAAMGEDVKLLDIVVYHGYDYAPEETYPNVMEQKKMVAKFLPEAELMQGENGCPSEMTLKFALPHVAWSEFSQAKWNMRRMLGDLGHDVRGNVFTITDFNHTRREINLKGLVRANIDRETIGIKRSFYAVQNVFSVFDDTLTRVKGSLAVSTTDRTLQLYEYRKPDGAPVFVFWRAADGMHEFTAETIFDHTKAVDRRAGPRWARPSDSFETSPGVFTVRGAPLAEPVWVDLLTGRIYEIPARNALRYRAGTTYVDVPVYDSPCLLTERRTVMGE